MAGSLPGLIDFYEHHGDDERFEILAFHDASVKSLAELDEKLVSVKKNHWGGRDLPFPVLHDNTGATIEQFGVRAFPTMILVDPEGRLVGQAHLDDLKRKLGIADGE